MQSRPKSQASASTSSTYFSASTCSPTLPSVPSGDQQQTVSSRRGQSVASTSARTSRISTSRVSTRPSTASGRKSRSGALSSILGGSEAQNIVCAVAEARGVTPVVGIALVNISLGEVTLSQVCDNQSYVRTIHKIQMSSPSTILFQPQACPPNKPSILYSLLEELVPEAQIVTMERSAWSETEGFEFIRDLAFATDVEPLKVALDGKFYATASFSAAMQYVEHNFTVNFLPHSLRVKYQPSEDTMMIDVSALQSLEIMRNQQDPKSKDCLYGVLNHTQTPMGARLLRNNMLQPPTRHDTFIQPRYDALAELMANEDMFRAIRKALKQFLDVERLLTKMIIIPKILDVTQVEEQLNQILMVKTFLQAVPDIYKALQPATSILLSKVRDICRQELSMPILSQIRQIIEPDVTFAKTPLDQRNQRTFAVKAGISGMLDVARQTYKELTEEIHQHVEHVNTTFNLNALVKYDNGRKYWLRLKAVEYENTSLPEVLINVVRKRGFIECQTLDLVKLNLRLSDTSNEVVIRSDAVVQGLVDYLRQQVPHLFRLCESVALLDMIASFGHLASTSDYTRPDFTGTLALKAGRHPILDKTMTESLVANDYYSTEQYCFHVVTGCNMSGKSTYIRAIAMLQIMAQVGSFVPAEYASFSIVRSIFARVSLDDSIEANLSTFSLEMREMAFILRNIDAHSLAIVDELGRGTSIRDGLAIAIAISEALVDSKASVWFATHFNELSRVLTDRPGVLNLHLAAKNSTTPDGLPHMTMLYTATAGTLDVQEHYGINLARAMGFPQSFTQKAEQVASDLRAKREASREDSEGRRMLLRRKLVLNLHGALKQAREVGNEVTLPGYLRKLQEEFIARMADLEGL